MPMWLQAGLKADYQAALPGKLKAFSEFLGAKSWLVGDQISYPDFHLYEMLDQHKLLQPDCLKVTVTDYYL